MMRKYFVQKTLGLLLLSFLSFFIPTNGIAQKVITWDLKTNKLDDLLPQDKSFTIKVVNASPDKYPSIELFTIWDRKNEKVIEKKIQRERIRSGGSYPPITIEDKKNHPKARLYSSKVSKSVDNDSTYYVINSTALSPERSYILDLYYYKKLSASEFLKLNTELQRSGFYDDFAENLNREFMISDPEKFLETFQNYWNWEAYGQIEKAIDKVDKNYFLSGVLKEDEIRAKLDIVEVNVLIDEWNKNSILDEKAPLEAFLGNPMILIEDQQKIKTSLENLKNALQFSKEDFISKEDGSSLTEARFSDIDKQLEEYFLEIKNSLEATLLKTPISELEETFLSNWENIVQNELPTHLKEIDDQISLQNLDKKKAETLEYVKEVTSSFEVLNGDNRYNTSLPIAKLIDNEIIIPEEREGLKGALENQKKANVELLEKFLKKTVVLKSLIASTYESDLVKRTQKRVTGLTGLGVVGDGINLPYLLIGMNYHFRPVNTETPLKDIPYRNCADWLLARTSIFAGVTFVDLNEPLFGDERTGIFNNQSIMVGGSITLTDGVFLNGGYLMYYKKEKNPLITKNYFQTSPFISLTIDVNLKQTISKNFQKS
ncbi:MAG: hypothetical protein DWQ02_26735 [Bacteroidetes bacterium]|nr:MAG: hypothetical protein DWQ02_26735 [Bacteroidota bacterium]